MVKIPEHDLSWAKEVLGAFDKGIPGTYGPYTVEVWAGGAKLDLGPINIKIRPAGVRVKIIGPTILGGIGYAGRDGWRVGELQSDSEYAHVIPDNQGWFVRMVTFPMKSIAEADKEL